jgi:hypothetical protein
MTRGVCVFVEILFELEEIPKTYKRPFESI